MHETNTSPGSEEIGRSRPTGRYDTRADALRLWQEMLGCTRLFEARLRARLRTEFDSSPARFDLMAQLDRHPGGLKMGELSRRLMVTGGNVTGLTDRLVAEALVERHEDSQDRRAFTVRLTSEGRRRFHLMANAHEQWLGTLSEALEPLDQQRLIAMLEALKSRIAQSPEP